MPSLCVLIYDQFLQSHANPHLTSHIPPTDIQGRSSMQTLLPLSMFREPAHFRGHYYAFCFAATGYASQIFCSYKAELKVRRWRHCCTPRHRAIQRQQAVTVRMKKRVRSGGQRKETPGTRLATVTITAGAVNDLSVKLYNHGEAG